MAISDALEVEIDEEDISINRRYSKTSTTLTNPQLLLQSSSAGV